MRIGGPPGGDAGEFAGHGLAEDHRTGGAHQRDARCIGRRTVAAVDRRTHLGRHVEGIDDVLDPDRQPVQRPAGAGAVERARLRERGIGVEIDPRPDHAVLAGDSGKAGTHHRLAAERAGSDAAHDLGRGEFVEMCRRRHAASRLFCGRRGDTAMGLRPAGRIMHELLDLGEHLRLELVRRLGNAQHVPPGREAKASSLSSAPSSSNTLA
jgi:hypothetical protein